MEFLRFGSSIPGSYWGCCACCIIQNFKVDPDAKASIQLVTGDGGGPIMSSKGEMLFAGPTWRDIFLQRIRTGTFDKRDMPNHAFIAILTDWQIKSGVGAKWLKILKETGFEFVRTVSNSVYDGQNLAPYSKGKGAHNNYIFMLVRNIGSGGEGNPLKPPAAWTKLDKVVPEVWGMIDDGDMKQFAAEVHERQTAIWNEIGPAKFLSQSEVEAAGAPVILAGQRVEWAKQQTKAQRDSAKRASGLFPSTEGEKSLRGEVPAPIAVMNPPTQ